MALVRLEPNTRTRPSAAARPIALKLILQRTPMNRSISMQSLLPMTIHEQEYVCMPASATGSCQDNRTASLGSTGTIVLTSSCRLLFIDRNAIGLLSRLDPGWLAPTGAQPLPPCLMTLVQEITAHSTTHKDRDSPSAHMSRLLGPPLQPVRVLGFMAPSHEGQDRRFVLVLSRSNL